MKKLLIILIIAVAVFACDDKPKDDTKRQTITFGVNNSLSTTVTGHMTNSQWDNVIGKLTTALNAAANAGGTLGPRTSSLFSSQGGINIDLVKTQEYNYYKIDASALTILLNADYVINATQADLSAKINLAINAGAGDGVLQQ
jgi:cytochrome oxidase Cu insertion factor (SCO1/SenC/PrrC family)